MTLDLDTINALGFGTNWFAQAWAYAVHRREENADREAMRGPRGERPRPSKTHPLTLTQKRQCTRWLASGKPVSEVATKLGVTRGAVMAWRALRVREAGRR